jgi:RNA polymerase sigma-70 factor, ECF subfamily
MQGFTASPPETTLPVSDDRSLVRKLQAQDQAAFTALYDRFSPLVYGVAKRILNNPAQAEDITQSVFTMLWTKPQAFAGGNFGAWIGRVARNASLDVLRSAAVRTREPQMPDDIVAGDDLEDAVFSRLQSSAVIQALRELPDEQRDAIEQAYFGGLSYSEVAAASGAPLGTVKSRIRTGLRRLWQTLQRQVTA